MTRTFQGSVGNHSPLLPPANDTVPTLRQALGAAVQAPEMQLNFGNGGRTT